MALTHCAECYSTPNLLGAIKPSAHCVRKRTGAPSPPTSTPFRRGRCQASRIHPCRGRRRRRALGLRDGGGGHGGSRQEGARIDNPGPHGFRAVAGHTANEDALPHACERRGHLSIRTRNAGDRVAAGGGRHAAPSRRTAAARATPGACTGCRASRSRRSAASSGFRGRWSGRFCGPGRRSSAIAGRGSRSPSWNPGRPSRSACWRRMRRGRSAMSG